MHNKYKALESCWNHLPQSQFAEKLSSIKPVSGCKKVWDCKYRGWGLWDDHKTMSVYKLVFMGLKTPLLENWIHWLLCLVALSCHTLCNNMDCSPPGSSVHGILQARILEWVAMPSFRGSSQPRDRTQVSCIADTLLYESPLLSCQ